MGFPSDFIMARSRNGIEFIKSMRILLEIFVHSSKRVLFKLFFDKTCWFRIFRFKWSRIFSIMLMRLRSCFYVFPNIIQEPPSPITITIVWIHYLASSRSCLWNPFSSALWRRLFFYPMKRKLYGFIFTICQIFINITFLFFCKLILTLGRICCTSLIPQNVVIKRCSTLRGLFYTKNRLYLNCKYDK